ncbi:MAG TPA: hypothetical protein PKM88_01355 [bacterium]|nr:hypothetical protein [bacterium]
MKQMLAMAVLMLVLAALPAGAETVTVTIPATATVVTFNQAETVAVAAGAEAWYKIYVDGSGMLELKLRGAQATQVAAAVYNERGELLGQAAPADGVLAVTVDASREYWFFIRLTGTEIEGNAELQLTSALAAPGPEFTVPADAAVLSFDEVTSGHVTAGTDRWFLLHVPADATGDFVAVEMTGADAAIDIDLGMTDADGRVLNTAESARAYERVAAQIPANRTVAVRVFIYRQNEETPAAESDFTLRAYTAAEQPAGVFAPNLPREFTAIETGNTIDGAVTDDAVWYRYHIEARGNLRVAFTGAGLQVAMLAEDGTELFNGTAADGVLRFTGDANKYTDFYVKVSGRGEFSFSGTLDEGEYVELPAAVVTLEPGRDMFGAMREAVWYRFTAAQSGYALLALDVRTDSGSDVDLMLLNAEGKVLGKAESRASREAMLVDVEKDATYYVRVYPYSSLAKSAEYVLWLQVLARKL